MAGVQSKKFWGGYEKKQFLEVVYASLNLYSKALVVRPLLTKSLTSGILAALAPIAGKFFRRHSKVNKGYVEADESLEKILEVVEEKKFVRKVLAFFLYGLLISGPLAHYFYRFLQRVTSEDEASTFSQLVFLQLKRIFLDRLLFGPFLLAITLYFLERFQGRDHASTLRIVKIRYFPAFVASLKIWTIPQFINVNYIAPKYRVLFAAMVAFIWNTYLAAK